MRSLALILPTAILLAPPCLAGKLDGFERSAERDNDRSRNNSNSDDDEEDCDLLCSILTSLFSEDDNDNSHYEPTAPPTRLRNTVRDTSTPRSPAVNPYKEPQPNHVLLPTLEAGLGLQNVHGPIVALSTRAAFGVGPFEARVRNSRYSESSADDNLNLGSVMVALRLPVADVMRVDVAAGPAWLAGDRLHHAFSTSLGLRVLPLPHLACEGTAIFHGVGEASTFEAFEADIATEFYIDYIGLRLGYHTVRATDDNNLSGPYAAIQFHY